MPITLPPFHVDIYNYNVMHLEKEGERGGYKNA